jgi:hypothetical protein
VTQMCISGQEMAREWNNKVCTWFERMYDNCILLPDGERRNPYNARDRCNSTSCMYEGEQPCQPGKAAHLISPRICPNRLPEGVVDVTFKKVNIPVVCYLSAAIPQ